MKVALAILFTLAIVAFGIFVDISWFLIGGIEEIARGAEASPVSGHDIGFGIVRILGCGLSTFGAVVLVILVWVGVAGTEGRRINYRQAKMVRGRRVR